MRMQCRATPALMKNANSRTYIDFSTNQLFAVAGQEDETRLTRKYPIIGSKRMIKASGNLIPEDMDGVQLLLHCIHKEISQESHELSEIARGGQTTLYRKSRFNSSAHKAGRLLLLP